MAQETHFPSPSSSTTLYKETLANEKAGEYDMALSPSKVKTEQSVVPKGAFGGTPSTDRFGIFQTVEVYSFLLLIGIRPRKTQNPTRYHTPKKLKTLSSKYNRIHYMNTQIHIYLFSLFFFLRIFFLNQMI